jgi:hypothetical protein
MGLLMLGCTLQWNVTQKDSGTKDMKMSSVGDFKFSEQTDIKKSIILIQVRKKLKLIFFLTSTQVALALLPLGGTLPQ